MSMTNEIRRAKELLKQATDAVANLESAVAELVAMRAWQLMGYTNLSQMWEATNGFKCPTYVQVLAVQELHSEGMNTSGGHNRGGHRLRDIAEAVGLPTSGAVSTSVGAILQQLNAGVPPEHVIKSGGVGARRRIAEFGSRARQQPRRIGKSPDELVQVGFYVVRRDADAITDLARKAGVTAAEIYRQAVAEYLQRLGKERMVG